MKYLRYALFFALAVFEAGCAPEKICFGFAAGTPEGAAYPDAEFAVLSDLQNWDCGEKRNNYNEISELCHRYPYPVFITKNGIGDLAVMSIETYELLYGKYYGFSRRRH